MKPFMEEIKCPVLSANIKPDKTLAPTFGSSYWPYKILPVGTERVGVVGYTSQETPALSRPGEWRWMVSASLSVFPYIVSDILALSQSHFQGLHQRSRRCFLSGRHGELKEVSLSWFPEKVFKEKKKKPLVFSVKRNKISSIVVDTQSKNRTTACSQEKRPALRRDWPSWSWAPFKSWIFHALLARSTSQVSQHALCTKSAASHRRAMPVASLVLIFNPLWYAWERGYV